MLYRLPNEMLLGIFKKTKTITVQNCSLLSLRFCNVIRRENFNIRLLNRIWLYKNGKSDFDMLLEFDDSTGFIYNHNSQEEQIQFLQTVLSKVQAHRCLGICMYGLAIRKEFVDKVLKHQTLRRLHGLHCYGCGISDELIEFAMSIKLNILVLAVKKGNKVKIPTEFFEKVAEYFIYVSKDITDFGHFDDKVLEKRLLNCKGSLRLYNCNTGLTEARREQLNNYRTTHKGYCVEYSVEKHIPDKWAFILHCGISYKEEKFKLVEDFIDKNSDLSLKRKAPTESENDAKKKKIG